MSGGSSWYLIKIKEGLKLSPQTLQSSLLSKNILYQSSGIVRSQRSFSCSRVRWYVALYNATHIALLRSPAIQPRQCPFPVVVLETEVLEFQVSILRQKVGILSGEFRFLVFHFFSLTPFDKFQVCSRDILIYQMVTMETDSCVMNLLMPRQKKRDTRSLLRLSSCNRHI